LIGTNDIAAGVSNSTILSNIQSACSQVINAGAIVLLSTLLPRSDGVITTAMKKQILALNGLIRKYAMNTVGIVLIDSYQYTADPLSGSYTWKNLAYTQDGIHLTGFGAFNTITQAIYDQLNTKISRTKKPLISHYLDNYIDDSSSQNLFYDPLIQNTLSSSRTGFTGASGVGNPVYHYFMGPNRQSGTPSASVDTVARADGFGNNQRVTITSTALNDIILLGGSTNNWLDSPFSAYLGRTVKFKCSYKQTNVPTGTFAGLSIYVQSPGGSPQYYCCYGQLGSFVLTNENNINCDTIIEGTPFYIPSTFQSAGSGTSFNIMLKFAGNASGAVFEFGRISIDVID
jgi:hypothetical protein